MKFDEDKFNECFDNIASPIVLHGGVPVVTIEGALIVVKWYLNAMQAPTNPPLRECPACGNEDSARHTCHLCGHKYYGEEA